MAGHFLWPVAVDTEYMENGDMDGYGKSIGFHSISRAIIQTDPLGVLYVKEILP
jgi:hypothetical protein